MDEFQHFERLDANQTEGASDRREFFHRGKKKKNAQQTQDESAVMACSRHPSSDEEMAVRRGNGNATMGTSLVALHKPVGLCLPRRRHDALDDHAEDKQQQEPQQRPPQCEASK
jgi:hypothetical protein